MNGKAKIKENQAETVKCVWGLLCNLSSVDQERNNISLFNIIEQFNLPTEFFYQQEAGRRSLLFPFPYEIVLCWRRIIDVEIFDDEFLADFKVKTVDPSGQILQEVLCSIKFSKGIKRLRSRIMMPGVFASVVGNYVHQIELKSANQKDFRKVLEIPFEIKNVNAGK